MASLARLLCFLAVSATLAAPSSVVGETPTRHHDIEVEDYFTLAAVTGCAVSPDGRYAAYTELRWGEPEEKRNQDLWLVEVATGETRRLTFDAATDGAPRWAPDGRTLYFTSNRKRAGEKKPPHDGKRQVWRMRIDGGEAQAVTRVKDGVGQIDLSHDGRTLYYTTSTEHFDEEWKSLRQKHKKLNYGHGVTKFSKISKLDLVTWRDETLIDEKRVITAFAVSPDERRIAMLTTPDAHLISNEGKSRVDVWNAASGEITTLPDALWRKQAPSPFGWLEEPAWSADGDALAFAISFDGYPSEFFVAEWVGEQPTVWKLSRPADVNMCEGMHLAWRGATRDLCFVGETRARARLHCIADVRGGRQGATRVVTPGDVVVSAYGYPRDGTKPVIVMSDPRQAGNLFAVESISGNYRRLTDVNPQAAEWKLPRISLVQWTGADGVEVQGVLELPPDYKIEDGPLPLVVEIHGGPTAATMFRLRYWIYGRTLLAAKGYAVLSPNYRGSTGYGDRFMIDLVGRENDVEVKDILAGVDAMIERGIADADRLGVMGWSNGGFLTNCLITTTPRFKAASSGAGVVDQFLQWAEEDTPGHVINYMQGLPWERMQAFRKASPSARLNHIATPTLIHVGENDARVPASHARTLYRALREYVKVPTELVVYPGAGHGLTKYNHRKAKMEWDLAWFEKYLKPRNDHADEAAQTGNDPASE